MKPWVHEDADYFAALLIGSGDAGRAVIKPCQAVEQMRLVPTRDSRVTDIALNTLDVQKRVPHRARLKLRAGGAGEVNGFEAPERGGKIITSGGDRFSKEESVLDGHAGALRQRLQRRVRGVS
jgi:hypothetical protein